MRETCSLCNSYLPNINSTIPVPHYPLQNRLVIDTMRRKLVNRILCDTCADEVLVRDLNIYIFFNILLFHFLLKFIIMNMNIIIFAIICLQRLV
jgi:hypothetical protein